MALRRMTRPKRPSVDPRPTPVGKKPTVKKPSVDPRPRPVGKRPPRGPSQDASKLAASMSGRKRRPPTGGTRKRVAGLTDSMNQKLAAQRESVNQRKRSKVKRPSSPRNAPRGLRRAIGRNFSRLRGRRQCKYQDLCK